MLTVCHTISSIADPTSGPSHSVPGLARAQSKLGIEVSIHSIGRVEESDSTEYLDRRYSADWQSWPVLNRLNISSEMKRSLNNQPCDIIHNHGLWMMPNTYGFRSINRSQAKLVFTPRGMLSSVALGYSPIKKNVFGKLIQNRVLKDVRLFHATSEQEANEIRAFGLSQPIAVIPNGIDLPDARLTNPTERSRKTVLSLGRIHPKKGLDILIRAWSELEQEFPHWDLLIVGPNENGHADELKALVKSLGVQQVQIQEPVTGDRKTELLAAADLFALSTKSENFAMTVAESLAAGTPVISTRGAPWEGLQLENCGWWIDVGVEPMADALRGAMSLPSSERSRMGLRGRAWMARDFSWEKIASQMLEAYSWLLEGGEVPSTIRLVD